MPSADQHGYMTGDHPTPEQEHLDVLEEAHALYVARNKVYRDVWQNHGLRGNMVKLRLKVERAWAVLWGGYDDVDDLLDTINYAAMCVRCVRDGNRDGTWRWSDR